MAKTEDVSLSVFLSSFEGPNGVSSSRCLGLLDGLIMSESILYIIVQSDVVRTTTSDVLGDNLAIFMIWNTTILCKAHPSQVEVVSD